MGGRSAGTGATLWRRLMTEGVRGFMSTASNAPAARLQARSKGCRRASGSAAYVGEGFNPSYPSCRSAPSTPTQNTAALEACFRGRVGVGLATSAGFCAGIEHVQRAVSLDPQFAEAHAQLGICLCRPRPVECSPVRGSDLCGHGACRFDGAAARVWGELMGDRDRDRRGKTPAAADVQIAAVALDRGLVLVTRNVKDVVRLPLETLNAWDGG
jgi:hypothetical protein